MSLPENSQQTAINHAHLSIPISNETSVLEMNPFKRPVVSCWQLALYCQVAAYKLAWHTDGRRDRPRDHTQSHRWQS